MPVEVLTELESNSIIDFISKQRNMGRNGFVALRNRLMFLFMLDAGLRVGEVVKLRNSAVWSGGEVNISVQIEAKNSKNGLSREVPMTSRLLDTVLDWTEANAARFEDEPHAYLFQGYTKNNTISTRQVNRLVNYAGIKCLKRSVHPHILRHTFGTRLMRSSNIRVVQELLGHRSITSTQVYTHPNTEDMKKAIDSMK